MIRTAAHGVFPGDITIAHDPRARVESCADQTAYRAELDAYYARNPGFARSLPVAPPYVPPPRPVDCDRRCIPENGFHTMECWERRNGR